MCPPVVEASVQAGHRGRGRKISETKSFSWLHHFDGTVDDLDGLQGHVQVSPSARAPCHVTVASKSSPGRSAPPPPNQLLPSCCSGQPGSAQVGFISRTGRCGVGYK